MWQKRRGRPTRIYAIDRERQAELDPSRVFEVPAGFDPRKHIAAALAAALARYCGGGPSE